jgi:hypothetical protein
MLFGSAVVFAFLLGGAAEPTSKRSRTHLWLQSETRPAPLPTIDLRPPIELKSIKAGGPSGFAVFVPVADNFSIGAGYSTYRVSPGQRAAQYVVAIRFRF